MELHTLQGESRKDCELKIASTTNRPYNIMYSRPVKLKYGPFGWFSKPGVEVDYYFLPMSRKPATAQNNLSALNDDDLETKKRKLIAAAGRDYNGAIASGKEASDQILNALKELTEKIDSGVIKEEHSSFTRATQMLKLNDFSENYINGIMDRMRKELPLEKLDDFEIVQDHLLEWIGESISIYKEEEITRKPKIFVLIGPTGVGKTTTIAKLAAFYGIRREDYPAFDVRMITIDALRICAFEQLQKMGDVMHIPVTLINAENTEQTKIALRREIAIHKDTELFFIDTFGISPRDASKIAEMKTILDGAGRSAEFHLAVSADTNFSSLENIFRVFEPFNYKSVVLTKMDEPVRIGNVISILSEKRKSVSYITCGQGLPADIKKATVMEFLMNLDGFKINRDKLEKRFPPGDANLFRWK